MVRRALNGTNSAPAKRQKNSRPDGKVSRMLESVVGCKWSMLVLDALVRGVRRPGQLQRTCEGISTKVLNERLRKLVRLGIARRIMFPQVPPRVEYHLTPLGRQFVPLIKSVRRLQKRLDHQAID